MKTVTLCSFTSDEIDIHVEAHLENRVLRIEGQDIGERVQKFWGDDEHEYFYTLSPADTSRFYEQLRKETGSTSDLLDLMKDNFSGVDGFSIFKEFCEKNSISVQYFSC